MYLSRLEILGFKSFAQKTVVTFNQGITSVVGPNGCGKTNIVDAIRWCLGEQRSGALRSDKMENVIFNGTANKKPMGMAEVSLTIQNNKGILPVEYSEVTITRRIFRSGESEYLLNKNLCRLKDITNLFMDTGMGTNAYSVIELKMIETILSSKADERRNMFEEAAGVNKYKLRRRLSLKKLDEVKADLTRVNDIVSEVEKKVNSLERQAKRADKYNKITSQLRELELELAEHEYALFSLRNEQSKEQKEIAFKDKVIVESSLQEISDKINEIKIRLNETEQKLKEKRSEISLVTEKIYNVQRTISVSEERQKSLAKNIIRFKQELEELNTQLQENQETIEESEDIIVDVNDKLNRKTTERNAIGEKLDSQKQEFDEKRTRLKSISDDLLNKFKVLTNKENDFKNKEAALQRRQNSIAKLDEKIQNLTGNIAKTVGFLSDMEMEKEDIQKKLAEAEAEYLQKEKEKEDLEKYLNQLKEKELEDKSTLNAVKDKIGFVQSLLDNLEGVSKGSKLLIEDNEWTTGDKTLLVHIGNSEAEYRLAIEAALKNNLNNILVENIEDVRTGINFLKNSNSGKASFYIHTDEVAPRKGIINKLNKYSLKKQSKKIEKESGFKGWARKFVITDEKWKNFFDKFLFNTVIVEDIDIAFELFKKYPMFNFAALNGDYIDRSGVIEAGAEPKIDDTIFGRKKLLDDLKNEFPVREQELIKLRRAIEELEFTIAEIDLKILSDKGKILVNEISNLDKQIAQIDFEKQKAIDESEKARNEQQDLAAESNKLDDEKNSLETTINTLRDERSGLEKEKDEFEAGFKKFEEEYNLLGTNLNKLNIDIERLTGEKKNTENAINRAKNALENIKNSIVKRQHDITSGEEEEETIAIILDERREEFAEFNSSKQKLVDEENEIDAIYKEIRSEINGLEQTQNGLRKQRDILSERIHSAEITLNEVKMKMRNLEESIQENYSIKLEIKEFEDLETYEYKIKSEEVHQLKQQVKGLGAINLLAYSEYEEEKQRLDFLLKQRNDLIDSEKDVLRTIEEINTTAQTLFMETFELIRGHFTRIFRGLFNEGDEADLRLEENADPLEAKIEIIAKPKGKRPTSIELLSGGEKTLTAIALLFAIYLVKPSPFCILDEIDAPLDDANIDRFTRIIRDFSKDTQFIVVTHNKRTMEAADTLYGVTMQEEGVSKLVSVRFNEELNFVN